MDVAAVPLLEMVTFDSFQDRKFVLPEVLDDLINSSNLRDADLADSIRRFRQWRRKAEGAWRNTNDNSETEINRGLVRKYDESMERIAELESKLSESQRKLMALESRLKDEEDFSKKYQRSLCKLYCLVEGTASTELIEEVRDGSGLKEEKMKRIPHIEVMNTIRKAFRNKDTELRELSVRIGVLCDQNVDLENKLVNSEKERKDVCDQLQYMRKELEEKHSANNEMKRHCKRLVDRLSVLEDEKKAVEDACTRLENELQRLQTQFQKISVEGTRKIREDALLKTKNIEENLKQRLSELNSRIDALQKENRCLKLQLSASEDSSRQSRSDCSTLQRKLLETETILKQLEASNLSLLKENDEQRTVFEAKDIELGRLSAEINEAERKIESAEIAVREIKQQRNEARKETDELSRQLFDLKNVLENEKSEKLDLDRSIKRSNEELKNCKTRILQLETNTSELREHNAALEKKLEKEKTKIRTIEENASLSRKEIEQFAVLKEEFQRERCGIILSNREKDAEIAELKEKMRKQGLKLGNLEKENITLQKKEAESAATKQQQLVQYDLLLKEYESAKNEIMELQELLEQTEKESKGKEVEVESHENSDGLEANDGNLIFA
ncbi:hypothetical protein AB6A40_003991 [Gnathostoma spinigerum]|uniref:Uncharacterized protein n=1 Tax=Gnathostoma spinigerum TaxID=75299 RepID=A0ABD6EKQ5_9BILA